MRVFGRISALVSAGAIGTAGLVWALSGDATRAESPAAAAPPPVPVIAAQRRAIPMEAVFTGRVEAVHHVEVRPRVSGALDQVLFREGSIVTRGAPLFRLDQRPFTIALRRAEAEVQAVAAQLLRARDEFARAERLAASDAMAVEEVERRRAEVAALEARLELARAGAQDAVLNLEFATVTAPVTGKIGRAEVTEGNLVNGGSSNGTRLAVLQSIDPIYVYFDLDPVTAAAASEQRRSWSARVSSFDGATTNDAPVDFVDNAVGADTGTLRVRARLDQSNRRLVPGSPVKVTFRYGTQPDATVVPDVAISTDQGVRYVLVAGTNDTIEYRPVAPAAKSGPWRVVGGGVSPGDRIVLPGMPGLRPGMRITPMMQEAK